MDCNYHHMPMENSPWSSSPMNGLNNAVDPITILTDADLQNELSLYATTQFTFDGLPNMPIDNKSTMPNHFNIHSNHRPPHLVINTMNTNNNDPCSSTISSPNDPQQHYFTPISSLPTSPTLNDLGDRHQQQMANPLLSIMLSPTSSHPNLAIPDPDNHQYMNRSASHGNDMILMNSAHGSSLSSVTMNQLQPVVRRRGGRGGPTNRGRPRRQPTAQQQQQAPLDDDNNNNTTLGGPLPMTSDPTHNKDDSPEQQQPEARLSKRQRNTAASARFRIKKKMREQCLQRAACEMTNKANFMENKVHELEQEIRWLKALLVAKNGCNHC